VGWIYTELVLVSIAAMLSPTTLTFCILALVLGERPRRTGIFFVAGAVGATAAIGVVAAFVIQDAAASDTSTPKTWVAVLDIVFAVLLIAYVVRAWRRPPNAERTAAMIQRMSGLASSPAITIVAAGATLANPGGFIPIALKTISETGPSVAEYIVEWLFFTLVSVLPILLALVMLTVAPEPTTRWLNAIRGWLEAHVRTIAAIIIVALALALLRNGVAGLAD
jgi:hypothetical protein